MATHVKFLTKLKNEHAYIMCPLKWSNVHTSKCHAR
jgi:hypothetical protein